VIIKDVPVGSVIKINVTRHGHASSDQTGISLSATVLFHDTDDMSLLGWRQTEERSSQASGADFFEEGSKTIQYLAQHNMAFGLWVSNELECSIVNGSNQLTQQSSPAPVQPSFDFNAYNQTLPNGNVITSIVRS